MILSIRCWETSPYQLYWKGAIFSKNLSKVYHVRERHFAAFAIYGVPKAKYCTTKRMTNFSAQQWVCFAVCRCVLAVCWWLYVWPTQFGTCQRIFLPEIFLISWKLFPSQPGLRLLFSLVDVVRQSTCVYGMLASPHSPSPQFAHHFHHLPSIVTTLCVRPCSGVLFRGDNQTSLSSVFQLSLPSKHSSNDEGSVKTLSAKRSSKNKND